MRTFIVVGHKATTSPDFSLEDIPGTSGRLDILCRCINAAFILSHGIRKDVCVYLILLGSEVPKTILLKGETLRHLNPDERTTAAGLIVVSGVQTSLHADHCLVIVNLANCRLPRRLFNLQLIKYVSRT